MKEFICVASNLIVAIDQIDKIHINETMARLSVYQQGQEEVYKDFETPEKARAEFDRISKLLVNPQRKASGFPSCLESLGACPELDQWLKKLQLVCDLKLQGETA